MNNQIEWSRAFIRSGFNPIEADDRFDFNWENHGVQQFLELILTTLEQKDDYKFGVFSPSASTVDEAIWLGAVEDSHTGSEGGHADMERFEIEIMDTYMAGIVRWVNAAGIETTFSCDGHGYIKAQLKPRKESQAATLNYFLNFVSNGDWRFHVRQFQFLQGDERIDVRGKRDWRRLSQTTEPSYDCAWLLDVAEKIHGQRDSLRHLVEISGELNSD